MPRVSPFFPIPAAHYTQGAPIEARKGCRLLTYFGPQWDVLTGPVDYPNPELSVKDYQTETHRHDAADRGQVILRADSALRCAVGSF